MDFAAAHWGYVAIAYALSFIFILGLTISIIARDRKLRAEAARLEQQRRKGET
jgi:heme exporter protein CcmD